MGADGNPMLGGALRVLAKLEVPMPRFLRSNAVPRTFVGAAAGLLMLLVVATTPARASFGLLPGSEGLKFDIEALGGGPATQAGTHPHAVHAEVNLDQEGDSEGGPRDVHIVLPSGMFANPFAVTQCTHAEFVGSEGCPNDTAIGVISLSLSLGGGEPLDLQTAIYNLKPLPGVPAAFGGSLFGTTIMLTGGLRTDGSVVVKSTNLSQVASVSGLKISLWGVPYDPTHDAERGTCGDILGEGESLGSCPVERTPSAFLTLPSSCSVPTTVVIMDSWGDSGRYLPDGEPDLTDPAWVLGHAEAGAAHGAPTVLGGCGRVPFNPRLGIQAGADEAAVPMGLNADITVVDEGLSNPVGVVASPIKRAVFRLPWGFTVNPAAANGLGSCSQEQYEAEWLSAKRASGCPESSKIGKIEFGSPILGERRVQGAVYVARQDENPLGSPMALYLIARNLDSGLFVKMVGRVELETNSGQVTMSVDGLPELPIDNFHVAFFHGPRAALAGPSACGSYPAEADLRSWADPEIALTRTVLLNVVSGPRGGPCPASGPAAPFDPRVVAGSLNVNAGSYTPFMLRITRDDVEQEISSFSTVLPPGLLANLTGVSRCSDDEIEAAREKTGAEEEGMPSCPAGSQIGKSLVGAGVGPSPVYIPGHLYLAGPYRDSPFSVVAITPAKVGSFDFGTFVVRLPLRVDLGSGQIALDSSGASSVPRIVDGVVSHVRDIRIYLDRVGFVINPTSCEPFSLVSDIASPYSRVIDDGHFQVANCLNLRLMPKMSLRLSRGSHHGAHPSLTAAMRPRVGDANIAAADLTLPDSLQLDPSRVRGLCARDALTGQGCSSQAQYGHAWVASPLLDGPLAGPVYLVNSKHKLPDLVASLEGSSLDVKLRGTLGFRNGRLRIAFRSFPDVPVSRFVLKMPGRKGLLVNNRDLCSRPSRAIASFEGHNGRSSRRVARVRVPCRASASRSRPAGVESSRG